MDQENTLALTPAASEAEKGLIACIIQGGRNAVAECTDLTPNHFYDSHRKEIFAVAVEMYAEGRDVDFVTVVEELKKRRSEINAHEVSGYIDMLGVPTMIGRYKPIVKEAYKLRLAIMAVNDVGKAAYDRADSSEIVTMLLDTVREIQDEDTQGFQHIKEVAESAFDLITWRVDHPNEAIGLPTGFKDLDKITGGFKRGELTILAARPSMGKTALGLQFASHTADQGSPIGFVTTEMSKQALTHRLLFADASVDSQLLNYGRFEDFEFQALATSMTKIREQPIYMAEAGLQTASSILGQCERLVMQHKIKLLVIDYLQLLNEASSESRQQEISKISRRLKLFAQKQDIPVIALSQLNRQADGRRPMLKDLRESGSIEQDADVVMFLWRPEKDKLEMMPDERTPSEGLALLEIAKQRNGRTGDITLAFLGKYARFGNYFGVLP